MKFFPTDSASHAVSFPAYQPILGKIIRIVHDGAKYLEVTFYNNDTGFAVIVFVKPNKPTYFRVVDLNRTPDMSFVYSYGSANVNVSFSPDFGAGDFDPVPTYAVSLIADNPASFGGASSTGGSGHVRISRDMTSDRVFVKANSAADANSVEIIDDTYFFIPDLTRLSGFCTVGTVINCAVLPK